MGVSKSFGPVQALASVNLEVHRGEIHAALGENGAGKSTLMNVVAGFLAPDSGQVELNGEPLPPGNPSAAKRMGIALVHQHFMLVPSFTVAENFALDQLDSLRGKADVHAATQRALSVADSLGWKLEPSAYVRDLPVGVQQRVEIVKALATDAPLLILDEPTAVLAPNEVEDLLGVLRRLREQGKTIVLIAHKLSEVFAIADSVTVLRRGKLVARAHISDTSQEEVARWMVGEETASLAAPRLSPGEPLVELREVTVLGDRGNEAVRSCSLEARSGEVLGIGGVDGNGQLELAEALAGIRPFQKGTSRFAEVPIYIPQDRQKDGLAMDMTIQDNLLIGALDDRTLGGPLLKPRAIRTWAEGLVDRFSIKIGSLSDPARSLSGGNQQKVVVARSVSQNPRIVVAVNPTRGLDLKATRFVHDQLAAVAANGGAVILISTDRDELASLATRTVFLSGGKIVSGDAVSYLGGSA